MKKLAGRFMIVSDTDLSVEEIVKGYKNLWRIERSFRTIKSFLEIRPVYSRKDRGTYFCLCSITANHKVI